MAHRLDLSLRVRLHLRVRLYAPIASWRQTTLPPPPGHNQPKQPAGVQREGGVRKRAGTRDCLEVRGLERAARCGTMHRAELLHPRRVGAAHGWRSNAPPPSSRAPHRGGEAPRTRSCGPCAAGSSTAAPSMACWRKVLLAASRSDSRTAVRRHACEKRRTRRGRRPPPSPCNSATGRLARPLLPLTPQRTIIA